MNTSPAFYLDKNDALHILKVCGWTCVSAAVAAGIALLSHLQVSSQYLFLVPLANTALVAAQRYATDHSTDSSQS